MSNNKDKIDWIQQKWRPMMAVLYMAICAFDFIIFPIGWTAIQAIFDGGLTTQWQPLTLQGGGLIHISFGAILGVAAWGRTQEKLAGVSNNQFEMGTIYIPPGQSNAGVSNQSYMNDSYRSSSHQSSPRRTMYASRSGPPSQIDRPI